MTWDFNNTQILLAALIAGQVVCWWVLLQHKRHISRQQQKIDQLENDQNALLSGSLGLGRKMFEIKDNLSRVAKSQEDLKQIGHSEKAFEQATHLLKHGASIDEVVQSCHLSQGEAELLRQMIGQEILH